MQPKRSKMISLRLSDEEYESLKTLYAARGVRSLSEFAREAMHRVLGEDQPPLPNSTLDIRVQVLDGKVALLEGELSRLSRVIETELALRKAVEL
jgi:hypothetical protein